MATNIKGLSLSIHGYWRFLPSSKGLPKGAPRPKEIALGTKDRDEAIRMVLDRKGLRDPDGRGIREWAEVYREEMTRTKAHRAITSAGVKTALDALVGWTGNLDAIAITRETAREWFGSLQKPGRSPATTHRYIRYARAFFSWLVERKVVKENPFSKMKLRAPRQSKRDRFCTAAERDRLIEACERDDLRGVLMLGFFLGLRINEIVNARWGWFTETDSGGYCTVRNSDDKPKADEKHDFTTKTGRERQIPVHKRLKAWLASVKPKPPADGSDAADSFILHPDKAQEKAYLRWDPSRPFRQLVKDCGMTWVTFHTMRHTFGSLYAIAGAAEIKIRRWMGITQETWNRHYAGLSPDDRDIDMV